jgi:hypothetical protein
MGQDGEEESLVVHWDVKEVRVEPDRTLFVRCTDGLSGRVRFLPGFFTGVFKPLRDPSRFAQAFVDNGAVAWPGDLDLAPDAMYEQIKTHREYVLTGESADALA